MTNSFDIITSIMEVMTFILSIIIILLFLLLDGVMVAMILYDERMDIMMKVIYIVTLILISMMSYGLYIDPIKGGGRGRGRRR